MIHTAKQLKDKVKNMSGGNSEVAQALIRTYFMERFLERVSVSEYRNNFQFCRIILKLFLQKRCRRFWQEDLRIPE